MVHKYFNQRSLHKLILSAQLPVESWDPKDVTELINQALHYLCMWYSHYLKYLIANPKPPHATMTATGLVQYATAYIFHDLGMSKEARTSTVNFTNPARHPLFINVDEVGKLIRNPPDLQDHAVKAVASVLQFVAVELMDKLDVLTVASIHQRVQSDPDLAKLFMADV